MNHTIVEFDLIGLLFSSNALNDDIKFHDETAEKKASGYQLGSLFISTSCSMKSNYCAALRWWCRSVAGPCLYVERCLVNMRRKGMIDKDIDYKELAKMMCCCREGAFMMWSKQKEADFGSTMATFIDYFEQLLGMHSS